MKILERIHERELVRTNGLGAERHLAIGKLYETDGHTSRITRHRTIPTSPWATNRRVRHTSMSDRIWTLMSWIVNDGATWAEVKHKWTHRRP